MSEGGEARLTPANVDAETTLIKRSENECRFVNNDLYASDADEEGEDGDDERPPTDALAYRRFGQGEQPTSTLFFFLHSTRAFTTRRHLFCRAMLMGTFDAHAADTLDAR